GFLAGGGGAVDTALGLDDGGIEVIAEEGLVPVLDPLRGVLLWGGLDRYLQAAVVLAGQGGILRKVGRGAWVAVGWVLVYQKAAFWQSGCWFMAGREKRRGPRLVGVPPPAASEACILARAARPVGEGQ